MDSQRREPRLASQVDQIAQTNEVDSYAVRMNENDETVKIVLGLLAALLVMFIPYENMTILDCINVPPEMTTTVLACNAVFLHASADGAGAFTVGYAIGSIAIYVRDLRK